MRALLLVVPVVLLLSGPAASQPLNRLQIDALEITGLSQSGIGRFKSFDAVPDVSGDGVADLAIGASQADNGQGAVFLYNAVTRAVILSVASPQTVQAENFGRTVAGLPDVTGDGRGDLAVWAASASVGGLVGAGRVYVINGATGAVVRTLVSPNPAAGGLFGATLVSVPDTDGDGVAELAVGAPDEDAPNAAGVIKRDVGRAYVYSGRTGVLLQSIVSSNPVEYSPFAFGLSTRGSDIGAALAGLPDVDGDGRGDLAVGAPGEWSLNFDSDPAKYDGRLYIVRSRGTAPTILRSPNAADRGNFSTSVAATPDLDGDGRADVLVGAPGENLSSAGDDEGRAYLVSGATGVPFRGIVSPEPTDDSAFGAQVGTVPDLNRDGVADYFATDPTGCCDKMPAFYVFDGRTGRLIYSVELPYITWDLNSVVGLPDVTGDGRGDFAVGVEIGSFDGVEQLRIFSGDLARAEVEPNDNRAEAQVIAGTSPRVIEGYAGGSDFAFNGGVSVTDADGVRQPIEDLFRIDLTAPGLSVTLAGLTDDTDLYVFRSDLSVAGQSALGGAASETVNLPALPAGTYYVGVDFFGEFGGTNNAGDWSPYTLTVRGALAASTAGEDPAAEPGALAIGALRPNPVSARAEMMVTMPEAGPARLSVLDVLGREVAVLVDGPLAAGAQAVRLDASALAPGVYLLRLETAGRIATRRFTRVQ